MLKRWFKAWRNRDHLPFKNMPDWALVVIGLICTAQVWYWGTFVTTISGPYIEATNAHGFPPIAVAIGVVLGCAGIVVLVASGIATRCGYILGNRHLE